MKRASLMLTCWLGVAALAHLLTGQHQRYQAARPIYRAQDLFLDLLGEGRTAEAEAGSDGSTGWRILAARRSRPRRPSTSGDVA